MTSDLGYAALVVAFVMASYSFVASLAAGRTQSAHLWTSARRGSAAAFIMLTLASGALVYALLNHDFGIRYVAEYSATFTGDLYTFSAWWAGLAGSLLFWVWLLAFFTVIVLWQNRVQNQELIPYVNATMMGITAYFVGMLLFLSNPFELLPEPWQEGRGLNPLLENPGMLFHPTTLYIGYVGFAVPFAFAIAALVTGRLGDQWIRSTRRWTLFAWLFLALGNVFGMQWAYVELGWGGFWGWDPVENASFMPWLIGTAYLHSVIIQQKRGMLKVWNIVLIAATFALVLFGTLLTRSGIISSVHSFSESNVGPAFIALITIIVVVVLALLWWRTPKLRSEHHLDALVSRESSFLLNNLLLVGIAFAVFWGTVFPILSEAVRGTKIVVGPPFYNQVTGPLFLALVSLMGVCALIGWRKASPENLARNLLYPLAVAMAVAVMVYVRGIREAYLLSSFSILAFVAASVSLEFYRGVRARWRGHGENIPLAFVRLILANRPRYGGYIVHVGILLFAMGALAVLVYPQSVETQLKRGETAALDDYTVTYREMTRYETVGKKVYALSLDITKGGKSIGTMTPEKYFPRYYDNPVTEVAIRSNPLEDLYIIPSGWTEDGATVNLKIIINPLAQWLWIGGAVVIAGTVIAGWPEREMRRKTAPAPESALLPEAASA